MQPCIRPALAAAPIAFLLLGVAGCDNSISIQPRDIPVACVGAEECFEIGASAENEPGVPDPAKNDKYARAAAHYDAACELDHAKACMQGGMIYWLGPSPVSQDLPRSVSMMERSCELGHAEGCSRLGDMYDNGWGVEPSPARALELYRQACESGYRMACMDAKRLEG